MFRSLTSSPVSSLLVACAAATIGLSSPTTFAVNVNPGGTVDPLPGSTLPSGSTQEFSVTKSFTYNITVYIQGPGGIQFPILRAVNGSMTQRIYRTPDNTLTFTYSVTNNSDSLGEITDFYIRDFSEYTTDLSIYSGIDSIFAQTVSSGYRAVDGGSIRYTIDAGISIGNHTRTVYVDTDATSFYSPGRYTTVSSRATVCTGGTCLNIYGFAYPVEDSSPPIVSLTTPNALDSVCSPAAITGRAYDPNGFDSYDLEYASSPNGPWTLITTSTNPVSSTGPLGSWNTNSPVNVAQGYYFLRLTAANAGGLTSSVTNIVFVDKQFDSVILRSPVTGQLLGGAVCFDGTISDNNGTVPISNYTISYAPLPAATPFLPVNPATPTYSVQVINDGLGSGWQTASGPASVADGNYRLRVVGTDLCGHTKTVTRNVTIDNTRPIATIASPLSCSNVAGQVTITGTASDAHMAGWTLQYSGGTTHGWVTINSGSGNVVNNTLGIWNTAGLPPCAYTIRLVASDAAGISCSGNTNQTEDHISVNVGCPGDFNKSGATTVQDLFDYLTAFFGTCP